MTVLAEVIDAITLERRIAELGAEISEAYCDGDLVLLGVLNGSVPFLADLSRHLPTSIEIDFLSLTRFGEKGRVGIAVDSGTAITGRHVLVVEDIVDTGLALSSVRTLLETRRPASVATVTLLDKRPRRIVEVPLEYRGFEVGDEFIIGYGLDWEGRYRNVPSLWAVLDLPRFQEDPERYAAEAFWHATDRLSG
ncbi:MAG TPA: hypoxanthine phosphoribosyltransferase [Acidimicrobiia bacterium]|nr:hypoxanthine phosphoribosyltransferase [Acidimicrobiia bacterium]